MGRPRKSHFSRKAATSLKTAYRNWRDNKHEKNSVEDPPSATPTACVSTDKSISGRRIITVSQWLSSLNAASRHGAICPNSVLVFEKETRMGLRSRMLVRCTSCDWTNWISSDKEEDGVTLPVNESLVWGTCAGASNFEASKQLMTVMDIPFPAFKTYSRHLEKLTKQWDEVLAEQIIENGKLEVELAQAANDKIAINGVTYPCTSVYADGAWCTRSYGHSFKSKGGVAVLIGARSKKLLYIGIKNMFCIVCKRASTSGQTAKEHTCYKNWDEAVSATVMESRIIQEGFRASIEMHGLVFNTLIADGDSSVYHTLVNSQIYPGIQIQKAECINHIVKNLNKFCVAATKATKVYSLRERQILKSQMHRMGKSLRAAINYRSQESPRNDSLLRKDIENIPFHTFGQHNNCSSYFCPGITKNENQFAELRDKSLWSDIVHRFKQIGSISARLMPNLTSNICESFMSRVAKFNHGKRLNVVQRGGWKVKASTSGLSFNKGSCFYAEAYKTLYHRSPSRRWKLAALNAGKKLQTAQKSKHKLKKTCKPKISYQPDADYGPNAADEDFDDDTVRDQVTELMKSKYVSKEQQIRILECTTLQSECEIWAVERSGRITASVAGDVFSLKDSTNNSSVVSKLLYPKSLSHLPAITHGKKFEASAIRAYERERNVAVKPSGLFVSLEHGVFAASPDGLVGDDGIIEVKCPQSMIGFAPKEMPSIMKKTSFLALGSSSSTSGNEQVLELKKNHKYYRQIVMQLHVSGRQWCDFVVYTFRNTSKGIVDFPLFIQRIYRDDTTGCIWEKMTSKLLKFYKEDLGPEIVNSRVARSMPIKQPNYRLEAIQQSRLERKRRSTDEVLQNI